MAKRSERNDVAHVQTPRKANKNPRVGTNGQKLPERLPSGVVLTDVTKKKWKLGKSIGIGGFGEIYLADEESSSAVGPSAPYVVKIEHYTNGPLFVEMHFYHRVGKEEMIREWVQRKKLSFLGMPRFVASGSHEHKGIKYRFMVMDRFGEDLQKILDRCQRVFPIKTVYTLGLQIIDVLEYVHSHDYIHADMKASNLLMALGKGKENKVYLVDFGLACRYVTDGAHKEYKPDLRKAHDGTIEFTSRDAHIGAHSRRGDLEILGYNMVQWLCGRLPWEDNLKVPDYVNQQKCRYMSKIPEFMDTCFQGKHPEGIADFLQYVASLRFDQEPDYERCRNILRNGLKKARCKNDGKLDFRSPKKSPVRATASKVNKRTLNNGNSSSDDSDNQPGPSRAKRALPKMPSENHSSATPPQPRGRRKPHSAAPGLQSSTKPGENFGSMFDNPTPAMLLVMQRKLSLRQEEQMKSKAAAAHCEPKSPKAEAPPKTPRRSPRAAKGENKRVCTCCSSRSHTPERNAETCRKMYENVAKKVESQGKKTANRRSPALRSRSNSFSPEF